MSPPSKLVTEDGHELQLQVNYLSHLLLAHELLAAQRARRRETLERAARQQQARRGWLLLPRLPRLRLGARSGGGGGSGSGSGSGGSGGSSNPHHPRHPMRVVLLSSLTHHAGAAQWRDAASDRGYSPFASYGLSKLANVMAAKELQRRIDANAAEFGSDDCALAVHPGIVNTVLATGFFTQTAAAAATAGGPGGALEAAARGALEALFPLVLRT